MRYARTNERQCPSFPRAKSNADADIPENSLTTVMTLMIEARFEDLPLVGQDVGQKIEAPSLSSV